MTNQYFRYIFILYFSMFNAAFSEKIQVLVTHPLLQDLVQQIGQEHTTVSLLIGSDNNLYHQELSSKHDKQLIDSDIVFLSGMGLEKYQNELEDKIGKNKVVDISQSFLTLATIDVANYNIHKNHAHKHRHNDKIDHAHLITAPHWWHSTSNWALAADVVMKKLVELDETNSQFYHNSHKEFQLKMEALTQWIVDQLSFIPQQNRTLVTSHAAFSYFGTELAWENIALNGTRGESPNYPNFYSEIKQNLKRKNIKVLFPGTKLYPPTIVQLAKDLEAKIAEPLITHESPSIEKLFQYNTGVIRRAFSHLSP